jgi:hypothetical protein
MDENERERKTFKEDVNELGTIPARYKPLKRDFVLPVDGYHRKPVDYITATGKAVIAWVKDHVHDFPCEHCGCKVTVFNGFDTDSAWIACKQCGTTLFVAFKDIERRMELK